MRALEDQVIELDGTPVSLATPAPVVRSDHQPDLLRMEDLVLREGDEAPAEVVAKVDEYLAELGEITLFVANDPGLQADIYNGTINDIDPVENYAWVSENLTDCPKFEEELNSYLESQAAEGFAVPVRAPTLLEYTEALGLPTEGSVPEDSICLGVCPEDN